MRERERVREGRRKGEREGERESEEGKEEGCEGGREGERERREGRRKMDENGGRDRTQGGLTSLRQCGNFSLPLSLPHLPLLPPLPLKRPLSGSLLLSLIILSPATLSSFLPALGDPPPPPPPSLLLARREGREPRASPSPSARISLTRSCGRFDRFCSSLSRTKTSVTCRTSKQLILIARVLAFCRWPRMLRRILCGHMRVT